MDAVIIISPPAGAPNRGLVLTRAEVQAAPGLPAAPCRRATRSRVPPPSRWTLARAEVIVSTSPVPKTPWPVSYFQERVSMLPPAGPLNSSAQTCFQGPFVPPRAGADELGAGASGWDEPAPPEQPTLTTTGRMPKIAATDRNRLFKVRVRRLTPLN